MKIWFQNRRSKVKKLVRHSPGRGEVHVTAAGDEVKTDQLSTGSADGDAAGDDDDDDDHGIIDNKHADEYHISATGSPSSPPSQPPPQQQLSHRRSSWDDVPSSFQRFPALTQLHYSYPLTGCNDARLSAVDSSTTSNWTDSYSSSVNRLQLPCSGDSVVSSSHMVVAAPRQFGYQSLFHGANHQWYSTQTSPQTLLTWWRTAAVTGCGCCGGCWSWDRRLDVMSTSAKYVVYRFQSHVMTAATLCLYYTGCSKRTIEKYLMAVLYRVVRVYVLMTSVQNLLAKGCENLVTSNLLSSENAMHCLFLLCLVIILLFFFWKWPGNRRSRSLLLSWRLILE